MKHAVVFFTIVASINLYSQQVVKPTEKTKLLVYYFHITNRCNTCYKIENSTKKVLETYFSKELNENVIIFRSFNCELPENKNLVEKYQAYGATLALTPIVSGKEIGIDDITSFAFNKINNETLFMEELKRKIELYLK
ncbi:MAG: nitrophenyl compound nitroreductase subunit ArsF family protein [Bacteroidales bacterium]|nr:nitrophenyl compound nitroreductase subunit ArsF family protein [Bacteroidales bacterium]